MITLERLLEKKNAPFRYFISILKRDFEGSNIVPPKSLIASDSTGYLSILD